MIVPVACTAWSLAGGHGDSASHCLRSEQTKITSAHDRIASSRYVELSKDALGVGFDGVERDVELFADLPLGQICTQQPEHSELSIISSSA